jgi:hypothetical protein
VRVANARRAEGATLQAIANELRELGYRSRIQAPMVVNGQVPLRRLTNAARRPREYLTAEEIETTKKGR